MEKIVGWGNYPNELSNVYEPKENEEIKKIITEKNHNVIARGLGRSYGDTSNNHLKSVISLNQFKEMHMNENGVLGCDGGVSFEEILNYSVPRGYFLPVTPGTKFVTVGGAIANDVHGKNHHIDGTISNHLISIYLMIASGEILRCSKTENAELFWATVAGIGTTGIILKAEIQMLPIESSYIGVQYEKANNIHEAVEMFSANDEKYRYSVAWIDCVSLGDKIGRSVLMRGNHIKKEELNQKYKNLLNVEDKMKITIPFNLPSGLLNNTTVKIFNDLYYAKAKNGKKIVDYDSFFYPLDAIHHWNRGYGKNGFLQYQMVFPFGKGKEGLIRLLKKIGEYKQASFLAVLKTFGEEGKGNLSFPMEGYTLALDIPIKGKKTFTLCDELDEIVLTNGGRTYLAKDARMSKETFYKMYGDKIERQLKIKKEVDPFGIFSSSMTRRIGL